MDPATHHPDPLAESFGHSAQHVAQFTSVVMAAGYAYTQYRARRAQRNAARDERTARELRDQQRAAYQQARMAWAPAHDSRWLAQADLIQTARAWGAAAPYADDDPLSASAMRKCEDRLRAIHPYAMARYDRLRAQGAGPIEAMQEAAPLFTRVPHARTGDPSVARPALEASLSRPPGAPTSARPAADGRTPAQVAAESFPYTADEVVAAAANAVPGQAPSSASRAIIRTQTGRPSRSA